MPKNSEDVITKRKVVLILVEGASDKKALSLIETFYKSKNLKVYTTRYNFKWNYDNYKLYRSFKRYC